MKATAAVKQPLTAREQLEALRAKIGKPTKKDTKGAPVSKVIGTAIDKVDLVSTIVVKELAGDDNVFARINVARMQSKLERGGYAS